jgi:hypothetical protein
MALIKNLRSFELPGNPGQPFIPARTICPPPSPPTIGGGGGGPSGGGSGSGGIFVCVTTCTYCDGRSNDPPLEQCVQVGGT